MDYLFIYEALRLDGLNHFEAMVEVCKAIEEDCSEFSDWNDVLIAVDDWCEFVEENACVR